MRIYVTASCVVDGCQTCLCFLQSERIQIQNSAKKDFGKPASSAVQPATATYRHVTELLHETLYERNNVSSEQLR